MCRCMCVIFRSDHLTWDSMSMYGIGGLAR